MYPARSQKKKSLTQRRREKSWKNSAPSAPLRDAFHKPQPKSQPSRTQSPQLLQHPCCIATQRAAPIKSPPSKTPRLSHPILGPPSKKRQKSPPMAVLQRNTRRIQEDFCTFASPKPKQKALTQRRKEKHLRLSAFIRGSFSFCAFA